MGEGLASDMSGTGCWSLAETAADALLSKRAVRSAVARFDGTVVTLRVEDTAGARYVMTIREGD